MPRNPRGIVVRYLKDGTKRYGVRAYDPRTKKKRWLGTYGTQREAVAAKRQFEAEAGSRRQHEMSVGEWSEIWMANRGLAPATAYQYLRSLSGFVDMYGDRDLSSISPELAIRFAKTHPRSDVDVIINLYNRAIDHGLVERNPFKGLGRGKIIGGKNLEVLGSDDILKLAESAHEVFDKEFAPVMEAMVRFTAATGLRFGEVAALAWSQIRGEILVVDAQITKAGARDLPKNDHVREVMLTPKALTALNLVPPSTTHDGVFYSVTGRPLSRGTLYNNWNSVRIAAGFPKLKFHHLRHHYATLMFRNFGDVQLVADQLGHQDGGKLVLELYSHINSQAAQQSIAARVRIQGDLSTIERGGALCEQPPEAGRGVEQ